MGARVTVPPRLLVVAGDSDLRDVFGTLLREEGYAPHFASTLDEALALADEMAFALVLTDLYAGTSPHAFTPSHILRRRVQPTPVGLLTTATRLDKMDTGHFAFVQPMPFDLEALLGAIATALDTPLRAERLRQREVVRGYFAALEAENWPALLALCTEDVAYFPPRASLVVAGRRIHGKDALRDYAARAASYYRYVTFRDLRLYDTPKGLVARYTGYWVTPDESRRQAAHTMFFHFAGELIAQLGVSVNLQAIPVINGALGGHQAG